MRITRPAPGARISLAEIDLAGTDLYVTGDAHLAWQTLRAQCPVFWQARREGRGFWAVTRRPDVRRVLADHETFSSECGTAIAMLDGPDPSAGLMMQATDPPRHRCYRRQLERPLSPGAVPMYAEKIRALVTAATTPAYDGGVWDIAQSFCRLPVAVGAMVMGLPEADVDTLLRLSFASLAPLDPRYSAGPGKDTAALAHCDIIKYFAEHLSARGGRPSGNLIGLLLTMEVDGRPLTYEEILLNCLSLLLGAVVTTSQAVSATLIALAEQQRGDGHWPAGAHVDAVVEEALRWSSPVTHFMRRARKNTTLHGTLIRAGDAVTAWIASANRDESTFDRPYVLDLARQPNKHVAFGSGGHRCLGSHLARLMLQETFKELMSIIENFEIADTPCHLVSNEIAGIVSLPLRVKLAASGRAAHRLG